MFSSAVWPKLHFSSDVKQGQNLETEAEARVLRPRPIPIFEVEGKDKV